MKLKHIPFQQTRLRVFPELKEISEVLRKMKIEKQKARWLGKADFQSGNPLVCTVKGTTLEKRKLKTGTEVDDIVLLVSLKLGDLPVERRISLWGNMQDTLMTAWGDESDLWLGKSFSITHLTDAVTGKSTNMVKPLANV